MKKTGILLLNTGSPAAPTPDAVRKYLTQFLTDPRICPMNPRLWRFILKRFVLPKRSVASAAKYAAIWTEVGSPLDAITESLANKLMASLQSAGSNAVVTYAMSYGSPSVSEVLHCLVAKGCNHIIALPLYPQSALCTTEAVRDKLDEALAGLHQSPEVSFVENYYRKDAYIDAVTQTIRAAGFRAGTSDKLLFVFHSIPTSDIKDGDTYPEQTVWTVEAIAGKLGLAQNEWGLGYQCRFDKGRSWLGPSANVVLKELIAHNSDLFVVAPNFSIDCLETLYDIDILMRDSFLESGMVKSFHYVPCLNDSDLQIALIESVIKGS